MQSIAARPAPTKTGFRPTSEKKHTSNSNSTVVEQTAEKRPGSSTRTAGEAIGEKVEWNYKTALTAIRKAEAAQRPVERSSRKSTSNSAIKKQMQDNEERGPH
jgi:hypothetical protein